MMKYLFASLLALVLAVSSVYAGDTNSLFNAKELQLGLGTSYVVDTAKPFQQDYTLNLVAGASYFATKNFGVEAWVPFAVNQGIAVQEVQAGLLARLPLSSEKPILKNIAPYAGIGGVYNWETDSKWAYIAKAGVEWRFNKKWGVFAEYQYRNDSFSNWSQGQQNVFGGLKLVF